MTPEEVQTIGKGLEVAKGYLDLILKPPLAQLGGILSDTVGYWRVRNQIRLIIRSKELLEARNVQPSQLSPNIGFPLLEAGGKTDDPLLQDMFAALLASHLDPSRVGRVHPAFSKVLEQFSSMEARIIHSICRLGLTLTWKFQDLVCDESGRPFSDDEVQRMGQDYLHGGENLLTLTELAVQNLYRLGVFEKTYALRADGSRDMKDYRYMFTDFGMSFCRACVADYVV